MTRLGHDRSFSAIVLRRWLGSRGEAMVDLEIAGNRFLAEVESVYAQIARFFAASGSELAQPDSQLGNPGFAALYTAPRQRPDLLILGQNPGNFGPNNHVWNDEPNRTMMSGQVPTFNSYVVHEHNFGRELRRYFNGSNLRLLEECVGLNVWFFQARGTPKAPPELRAFCEETARRLVRLIEPKVILCLSRRAFVALQSEETSVIDTGETPLEITSFGSTPMIYAHHPTSQWTRQDAVRSIPAAITWINCVISGNQKVRPGATDREANTVTKLPCSDTQEVPPTDISAFRLSRFSFAYEAAQHILDATNGKVADAELNDFVLAWGIAVGKSLKNTEGQNRNRVIKYRKRWLKHRHCRNMNA